MYQVYSVQQPGRPRWALVACAVLLLLTMAMAAALVREHARAGQIELTESRFYPQARLHARVPAGWTEIPPDRWPPGVLAGFAEPQVIGGAPRRVFLFRGPPDPTALPGEDGMHVLALLARQLVGGEELGYKSAGFGQVGALPGVTLARWSVDSSEEQPYTTCSLCRVAVAPGGQMLGALLVIPDRDRPRRVDHTLLDQLCQHLDPTEVAMAEDAEAAMTDAGIRFDPPAGVWLVANDDRAIPRVRLMPAGPGPCWFVDAYRVPLVEGRTPAMLVEDYTYAILRETELPGPVETTRIGDREVVSISAPTHGKADSSIYLLCARTDQRTALMLIGRHEPQAGPALHAVCRSILATATVRASDDLLDAPRARQTAREWLDQVQRPDALAALWDRPEQHQRLYAVRSPAVAWGYETRTVGRDREDGAWMIANETRLTLLGDRIWRSREAWRVPDDPAAFELVSQEGVEDRGEVTYHEQGHARTREVERRLAVSRKDEPPSQREDTVRVDEVFACEPILLAVGGRVARDPQRRPAMCTALETFAPRPAPCIMVPLGEQPLPGDTTTGSAWAVRLVRDYYPAPITFYYDQSGLLVAIRFDEGEWRELTEVRSAK